MGYVRGTETEAISFTDTGIEYVPAGPSHAVDLGSAYNTETAALAYAVCGAAVRAWPDQPFEPAVTGAHDQCIAVVRGTSQE